MKPHSSKFRTDLISDILSELYEVWKEADPKTIREKEPSLRVIVQNSLIAKTSFNQRTRKDYEDTIVPKAIQMLQKKDHFVSLQG